VAGTVWTAVLERLGLPCWNNPNAHLGLGLGLGLELPLFVFSSCFMCLACIYRPGLSFKTSRKVIHNCFVEISTSEARAEHGTNLDAAALNQWHSRAHKLAY
jgi:hypothetical protein